MKSKQLEKEAKILFKKDFRKKATVIKPQKKLKL